MLFVLFFVAPQDNDINIEKVRFDATSSALLRFKNVRMYFYEVKEYKKERQTIYKFKNQIALKDTLPMIHFSILHHIATDQFYILPQFSNFFENLEDTPIKIKSNNLSDTIYYQSGEIEKTWSFSAQIFNALNKDDSDFYAIKDGKEFPMFKNLRERKQVQIALKDYFTLTKKY